MSEKYFVSRYNVLRAEDMDELAQMLTDFAGTHWSITVIKTTKTQKGDSYECLIKIVDEAPTQTSKGDKPDA